MTTVVTFTCKFNRTVAAKSVHVVFACSAIFTRTAITFVNISLATGACNEKENKKKTIQKQTVDKKQCKSTGV